MSRRQIKAAPTNLTLIKEPRLLFGHSQRIEDPKDGLLLFGPSEARKGIDYGVIGTREGIARFERWAKRIGNVIAADVDVSSSVTFPGYETLFRTPWSAKARVTRTIDDAELSKRVSNTDAHQRVYDVVDLFAQPIAKWSKEEDETVDLWFVVVPEEVWKSCRPKSVVSAQTGTRPEVAMSQKQAFKTQTEPFLFDDLNQLAKKYLYENHFHNQLKARLLECEEVTQIVRETTIAPQDFLNKYGDPARQIQDDATVAWNLATAIHYKASGKPWSLADVRAGVCYIGLVFKRTDNPKDTNEACCGAQMFLNSGEGIVFKGSVGPWATEKAGDFHLTKEKATEIVRLCVEAYKDKHNEPPKELFIHGRTAFNPEEIEGFSEGAPGTIVTGIQITRTNEIKLFRDGRRPVLRGMSLTIDERSAYLWTSGYVPHLKTYPGREVPTPLKVRIVFGDSRLSHVLDDIMSLTKLNFNTCIYGDGYPVTLRFADDVGEILTAIPEVSSKPLPFKHYI